MKLFERFNADYDTSYSAAAEKGAAANWTNVHALNAEQTNVAKPAFNPQFTPGV